MPDIHYRFDVSNLNSKNPYKQFDSWLQDAKTNPKIKSPNVACLTTCSSECQPSCRMIQIVDHNEKGFLFFTHYGSKKAKELELNNKCSLCFYWDPLDRQVVMNGKAEKVSEQEAMEYFTRRPVKDQLKSLASDQGKILKDKQELVDRKNRLEQEFESTKQMRLPDTWCGFMFTPEDFDFWQGYDDNDLDDRIRFRLKHDHENQELVTLGEGFWVIERLGA